MNLFQAWLIVGIPAVVTVAALFAGRSQIRAIAGFVLLAALLVFFLTVTGDMVSSAAIGLLAVFLVATGRGTASDEAAEEHEQRKRYTTDPSQA